MGLTSITDTGKVHIFRSATQAFNSVNYKLKHIAYRLYVMHRVLVSRPQIEVCVLVGAFSNDHRPFSRDVCGP